ncbi:Cyanovirin-N [Mycena venus]|uniref:Cyanovirin-N n=1 Tax=Mycena venus TaxID=2733690 RepID=A0A8H6XF84_9AGAR|nr:Cyanovirin-N [Mycena venus]
MNTFVSFVLLAVCTVTAIPSILSAPLEKRDGNFSFNCKEDGITANGVLTSGCADSKGAIIPASLSLDSCVGNIDGQLTTGFSGFSSSCTGITLVNPDAAPGVVLSAQCTTNDGRVVISGLNLDKFVTNTNGVLGC